VKDVRKPCFQFGCATFVELKRQADTGYEIVVKLGLELRRSQG
jgi:hypothetical protein